MGTKAWPEGTMLKYNGKMFGAKVTSVPLPRAQPGEEVDIHVPDLRAPDNEGRHYSNWIFVTEDGKRFGDHLWAL
jgi:hypothetical protein